MTPSAECTALPPIASKSRLKNGAGCDFCRNHHLKCDEGVPRCTRCQISGVECHRHINFRFRHETRHPGVSRSVGRQREFVFPFDQKWTKIPKDLTIIDETSDIQELYLSKIDIPNETGTSVYDCTSNNNPCHIAAPPVSLAFSVIDTASPTQSLDSSCLPFSTSEQLIDKPRFGELESPGLYLQPESPYTCSQSSPLQQSQSPVSQFSTSINLPFQTQNESEAKLFRHFVEDLSSWFDLTDPTCSFRREVHDRVRSSHTLENAIYAISSRHLACLGKFDPLQADRYSEKCLESFIDLLSNTSAATDDSLLAATVILRVTEELQVPWTGHDSKTHIIGTKAFIRSSKSTVQSSNFRKAAFWTGLRQEINLALLDHSQIQTPLDLSFIDASLGVGDEGTWANRIVVNLAEILNFCFGENSKSIARYRKLKQYSMIWAKSRPSSMMPFFTLAAKPPDEYFPQIWYSGDAAVMAAQYHNITRLLLASFNPEIPRVGPDRLAAVQHMECEVREVVKELCGIGVSNPRTVPALLVACQGISLCGDYFIDSQERLALLDVLQKTNFETAWPTNVIQERLRTCWKQCEGLR